VPSTSTKKIAVFLTLTFVLSSVCYSFLIIPPPQEIFGLGLVFSPAIAACITQLIFERNVRQLGWPLNLRYLPVSYGLPLVYGLAVYGIVWLSGIGTFSPQELVRQTADQLPELARSPQQFVLAYTLRTATLGMLASCVTAFGEELGWRGLLVPELAKRYSFTTTALVSGVAWALWHYPAILFVEYNNAGAPLWFGMICFTILVIGLSFVMAWLRLRSGSVWTAVLLHASHNIFIQTLFNPLTAKTGLTPYVIDEFGIGLALATAVLAYVCWRRRGELPQPAAEQPSAQPAAASAG